MRHILLSFLLLLAAPLGAQTGDPALRSGSTVRLLLSSRPSVGALLGIGGDTLRVITPELGLARVPLAEVAGVEVPTTRKTGVLLGGTALGGAAAGMIQGEGFIESVLLGTALAAVVVLPASASEAREWRRVALPPRWRDEPAGARVRVSAPGFTAAELRLRDFRGDSAYFVDAGAFRVSEITSLELSVGRNRRRGVAWGSTLGAVAGVLYGVAVYSREGGEPILLLPLLAIGSGVGGGIGGLGGYLLAPRRWDVVPLAPPRRIENR